MQAGHVNDRKRLSDWVEADLCFGLGRNEAIFFIEARRSGIKDDSRQLKDYWVLVFLAFQKGECASCFGLRSIFLLGVTSSYNQNLLVPNPN